MANELKLRGLIDAVTALEITGVKKVYTEPPPNTNRPQTPALWPELPFLERGEMLFSCDALNVRASLSFVVAIAPYGQKTQEVKFDLAVDMADAIKTALDTLTDPAATTYFCNFLDLEISVTTDIQTMTAAYWGVRATVTAENAR